jgi:peptidyl-prolyl cis-trans isomerase B (cyclophilin B)
MTLRAETAARRRRNRSAIAAGALVLAVLVAVGWILIANNGGKKKAAAPAASGSAGPSKCEWLPLVDPSASPSAQPLPPGIKDVGTPPTSGEPRSGFETMTITTNRGVIKIVVDTAKSPCTAASFTYLAGKHFFDNTECHRMTTTGIYVLQCGDPSATGAGGPAYRMAEENLPVSKRPAYAEGVVAMAKTQDVASTGSQFFIVYQDTELDPNYTVLGRVIEGLDIVKKVAADGVIPADPSNPGDGKPKDQVKILSLTMSAPTSDAPTPGPTSAAPSTSASASAKP